MPLFRSPESFKSLQLKYANVLDYIWYFNEKNEVIGLYSIEKSTGNLKAMSFSPNDRPGTNRNHVFDFKSGLRLIISCEYYGSFADPQELALHVSGSVTPNTEAFTQISKSTMLNPSKEWNTHLVEYCALHFKRLSGKHMPEQTNVRITEGGVVHFTIKPEESDRNESVKRKNLYDPIVGVHKLKK